MPSDWTFDQIPQGTGPFQRHSPTATLSSDVELIRLLREAEQHRFTAEELQAALAHCGSNTPISWLLDNWPKLIDTVQNLSTKYGQERKENIIGTISAVESRDALRMHKGNVWHAVTECIQQRQRKFHEIMLEGSYQREDVVWALTAHQGNVDLALMDLAKSKHIKPFSMKVWGPPTGVENESGNMMELAEESLAIQRFISDNLDSTLMQFTPSNESTSNAVAKSETESIASTEADNSPNILRDIEKLIGNMELKQSQQNEDMLQNIEQILGHVLAKHSASRPLSSASNFSFGSYENSKSVTSPIPEEIATLGHNLHGQVDQVQESVKVFMEQHIQDVAPDVVEHVEHDLDMYRYLNSAQQLQFRKEFNTLNNEDVQDVPVVLEHHLQQPTNSFEDEIIANVRDDQMQTVNITNDFVDAADHKDNNVSIPTQVKDRVEMNSFKIASHEEVNYIMPDEHAMHAGLLSSIAPVTLKTSKTEFRPDSESHQSTLSHIKTNQPQSERVLSSNNASQPNTIENPSQQLKAIDNGNFIDQTTQPAAVKIKCTVAPIVSKEEKTAFISQPIMNQPKLNEQIDLAITQSETVQTRPDKHDDEPSINNYDSQRFLQSETVQTRQQKHDEELATNIYDSHQNKSYSNMENSTIIEKSIELPMVNEKVKVNKKRKNRQKCFKHDSISETTKKPSENDCLNMKDSQTKQDVEIREDKTQIELTDTYVDKGSTTVFNLQTTSTIDNIGTETPHSQISSNEVDGHVANSSLVNEFNSNDKQSLRKMYDASEIVNLSHTLELASNVSIIHITESGSTSHYTENDEIDKYVAPDQVYYNEGTNETIIVRATGKQEMASGNMHPDDQMDTNTITSIILEEDGMQPASFSPQPLDRTHKQSLDHIINAVHLKETTFDEERSISPSSTIDASIVDGSDEISDSETEHDTEQNSSSDFKINAMNASIVNDSDEISDSETENETERNSTPDFNINAMDTSSLRSEKNTQNLSDMVIDTRKLIQQMKDEINSDIASFVSDDSECEDDETDYDESYSGEEWDGEEVSDEEEENTDYERGEGEEEEGDYTSSEDGSEYFDGEVEEDDLVDNPVALDKLEIAAEENQEVVIQDTLGEEENEQDSTKGESVEESDYYEEEIDEELQPVINNQNKTAVAKLADAGEVNEDEDDESEYYEEEIIEEVHIIDYSDQPDSFQIADDGPILPPMEFLDSNTPDSFGLIENLQHPYEYIENHAQLLHESSNHLESSPIQNFNELQLSEAIAGQTETAFATEEDRPENIIEAVDQQALLLNANAAGKSNQSDELLLETIRFNSIEPHDNIIQTIQKSLNITSTIMTSVSADHSRSIIANNREPVDIVSDASTEVDLDLQIEATGAIDENTSNSVPEVFGDELTLNSKTAIIENSDEDIRNVEVMEVNEILAADINTLVFADETLISENPDVNLPVISAAGSSTNILEIRSEQIVDENMIIPLNENANNKSEAIISSNSSTEIHPATPSKQINSPTPSTKIAISSNQVKSQKVSAKKIPVRKASLPGLFGPLGTTNVRAMQQEFLNKQPDNGKPSKIVPPKVYGKPGTISNSLSERITKFIKPFTSGSNIKDSAKVPSKSIPLAGGSGSGASSTNKSEESYSKSVQNSLGKCKIPKKNYHETCFSDDYQSSDDDDEPPIVVTERRPPLRQQSMPNIMRLELDDEETFDVSI